MQRIESRGPSISNGRVVQQYPPEAVIDRFLIAMHIDFQIRLHRFIRRLSSTGSTARAICRLSTGLLQGQDEMRSEERRVGKESVSRCRSRWERYQDKKKQKETKNT